MCVDSSLEAYLTQLKEKLPELASSGDLVALGLFSSQTALSRARKRGETPTFIRFSRGRILYPRDSVLDFLVSRTFSGSVGERNAK
jgi:hypothetical protein